MQRHKLVSWSHVDIKPYPDWLMKILGMSTFRSHAPFVLCPFFCFYTSSRSHGSQMDPSLHAPRGFEALFTASLEKGGGWMVFRLLAVGGG